MLRNKKFFLLFAFAAIFFGALGAQTNSPYSRYGYGVLKDYAIGPSRAMGGIGYGLRTNFSANPMNPASYSKVDSLTFLFDIGVDYTRSNLSREGVSQGDDNGGLEYITILLPLSKRLGVSAGVLPFSSVGYSFGSFEKIGDLDYTKSYTGSGGLSQVYLGLGYKTPLKGLSVGANAFYLFGSVEHSSSLPYIGVQGSNTALNFGKLRLNAFRFNLGLQYQFPVSDKYSMVVGGVYTPRTNSKGDYESYEIIYNSIGEATKADTLNMDNVNAGLPETIGAGLTFTRNNKFTLGFDVTYQRWENVKFSSDMGDGLTDSQRFNDRWKYNLGAEYVINPYERNFFKRIRFRGGAHYGNSYMNVKNNTDGSVKGYDEYGATIGFGLPIRDMDSFGGRTSYININFEYKKLKPESKQMIDEQYFGVSLNVNINEMWFLKRKAY